MLYAADWQVLIDGVWQTIDKPTSTFLEAGFNAVPSVKV